MRIALPAFVCMVAVAASAGAAPPRVIDDFDAITGWSARPADGVQLALREEAGTMRLDFNFVKGGGYAVVHKDVALDLPANYRFRFRVRGVCPPENLEFKLIDSTGENVWWSNQRDFKFTRDWQDVALKKRHISFAWGPLGGGEIRHVAAIEFAITAGSGGKGIVWLDELTLEALPPPDSALGTPKATASSLRAGGDPGRAVDGNPKTYWASAVRDKRPWIQLDFGGEREYGGVIIDWGPRPLTDYAIEASDDARTWRRLRTVHDSNGPRDAFPLPETESRYLRILAQRFVDPEGITVAEIKLGPLEWSSSLNQFFHDVARRAPPGHYPRAFSGEQSYWTVVGLDSAYDEALIDEDGRIEPGKATFSIEPFLWSGGKLMGWEGPPGESGLVDGDLPIPWMRRSAGGLELEVSAAAVPDGARGNPGTLFARYRIRNMAAETRRATLYLTIRPFQVNPPTQTLGSVGGVATVRDIAIDGRNVRVNGDRVIASAQAPAGFGAAAFDEGDVVEWLARGALPTKGAVRDSFEHASGALAYSMDLAPGAQRDITLQIPFPGGRPSKSSADSAFANARRYWRERLDRVTIELPDTAVARSIRSQLAFMLVNRDSVALQPGSRAYERSWIRDGALMSTALLRLDHANEAREFIEWYAKYQYDNGKVPCCVDYRGADPVPEHDSSGELIFAVAEYTRYTGDRSLAERLWPHVSAAATYLDSLRAQRRTPEWRNASQGEFYGLLPPSISHEGYSAKPMHSYWDDFFALRGFRDAAWLAGQIGRGADSARWASAAAEFGDDLRASIEAAMRVHKIDYIPGCADLGDFDATSTAIGIAPLGLSDVLPDSAVNRTFERYSAFVSARSRSEAAARMRDSAGIYVSGRPWEDYTPYEARVISALVRLGQRDRANELLRFLMLGQRPAGWLQWAEVVGRIESKPRFVGDMPHSWVGAEFIRSALDMLAYETDRELVIGAGVPWKWLADGQRIVVKGLPTRWGALDVDMQVLGDNLEVDLGGALRVPKGGVVLRPPAPQRWRRAWANVRAGDDTATVIKFPIRADGSVVVDQLPAKVTFAP